MSQLRWDELKKTVKGDASMRLFLAWSEDCYVDSACRIQLKFNHRNLMKLPDKSGDVLFVGAGDHLELWSPEIYEKETGIALERGLREAPYKQQLTT